MPNRSSKAVKPKDTQQLARHVLDTVAPDAEPPKRKKAAKKKDPAAVALGRKGGPARAAKMTAEERAESARKAAKARWGHESP